MTDYIYDSMGASFHFKRGKIPVVIVIVHPIKDKNTKELGEEIQKETDAYILTAKYDLKPQKEAHKTDFVKQMRKIRDEIESKVAPGSVFLFFHGFKMRIDKEIFDRENTFRKTYHIFLGAGNNSARMNKKLIDSAKSIYKSYGLNMIDNVPYFRARGGESNWNRTQETFMENLVKDFEGQHNVDSAQLEIRKDVRDKDSDLWNKFENGTVKWISECLVPHASHHQ